MTHRLAGIPSIIFFLVITAVFLRVYFRYFERKSIFYPVRQIAFTPADAGLAYEEINFSSAGEVRINGWFVPAGGGVREPAAVLFCHGNAGNIGDRLDAILAFHQLGLDVLIFDYRGYGKSGGRPDEPGIYADARAAYAELVEKRGIPPEKVVLFGESLGGAVAIALAEAGKAGALICEGTFTSIADMSREIYPFLPARLLVTMNFDGLSRVGKIDVPKLFIHSVDDEVVPFRQAERLYAAAREPKEFYRLRGGHNEAAIMAGEEWSRRIGDFLTRNRIIASHRAGGGE